MCLSSFQLMVNVALSNPGSLLFTVFLKGSAHIVGKLVTHPRVLFCSGTALTFLVHPSVHHAHQLKSTALYSR